METQCNSNSKINAWGMSKRANKSCTTTSGTLLQFWRKWTGYQRLSWTYYVDDCLRKWTLRCCQITDIIELNTSDIFGWTAFIYACTNGHTDVVKLLLDTSEMNIDLNARSNEGSTAIMLACRHGHKDVVQLLLNHSDIDLYVKDNSGRTALMIARRWKRKDIVYLLELKSSSYVIL